MTDFENYAALLHQDRVADKKQILLARRYAHDLARCRAKGAEAEHLEKEINDLYLKLQFALVLQDRSLIDDRRSHCVEIIQQLGTEA